MTARAYAKINLGLRILRKREDGYHDIETVLRRIDLFDEISFEPASTISLACNRHDLPSDDRNLCVRTAGLLQKMFGLHKGVHMTLKKNIPIGAGLGGGSADGAVVVRTLPQWWGVRLDRQEMLDLARELGADVPYFLKPGTAYATGKGEVLEYFQLDLPYWIVVVYPNLRISTAWAYQHIQIKYQQSKFNNSRITTPTPRSQASLKNILLDYINEPRMLMNLDHNDFEPLILRTHEPVARVKQALYVGGAEFAQMSGSGSSVYGLFEKEGYAKDAARELANNFEISITPPHFIPET